MLRTRNERMFGNGDFDLTLTKTPSFVVCGFAYLNSEHYCRLRFDIDQEMLSAIRRTGDSSFIEFWELCGETLVRREEAMMANVQTYCGENPFNKGVFLVWRGSPAGHNREVQRASRGRLNPHGVGL